MKKTFALNYRCIQDIARYIPGRIPAMCLFVMLQALSPYVTIWFSARLVDELAGMRRPEILLRWALLTVCAVAAVALLTAAADRWVKYGQHIHNPSMERLFIEKFYSMDYENLDNQKVRDLFHQLKENANWQGWGINKMLSSLQDLLHAIVGILGAIALTVSLFLRSVPDGPYTWLNSPLIAAVMIGWMTVILWFGSSRDKVLLRKVTELAQEATLGNRMFTALLNLTKNEKSLDVRTYHQEYFLDEFSKADVFNPGGAFDKLGTSRISMMSYLAKGCSALFTGTVYVFTCLKAWAGAFTIGSVTQYVGAATALSGNIAMLLESIDMLRSNSEFIEQTYEFLDLPNHMYQGSLTTEKRSDRQYQVEFRDVSFKYPGCDSWALRHVNMMFQIGKRLAIVGENGSGKTTFIKLLCRLYDPQEGQILLNGIDIRKYRYDDYMQIFSVVFQDFQLLSQPLGANVAGCADYDCQRVRKALVDAGFGDRLETMPQGLDTMLYKDFSEDGVEVSGGEAQKIAIARALYKDAPFIILDEPTAALDPIAEAEIYGKFNEISGDRTAIYISHRLSSCKFCDEIAVFEHGQVIQQGSHEQLLSDETGKYAELWNAQAQYYLENNNKA